MDVSASARATAEKAAAVATSRATVVTHGAGLGGGKNQGGKGGAPPPPKGGKGPAPPSGGKGGKGMSAFHPLGRKWHWKNIHPADAAGTVFERVGVGETGISAELSTVWRLDVEVLRQVFLEQKHRKTKSAQVSKVRTTSRMTVLDPNRAKNLQIGLVGIRKHGKVSAIVDCLRKLDWTVDLMKNPELIEVLTTVLPTREETIALSAIPNDEAASYG